MIIISLLLHLEKVVRLFKTKGLRINRRLFSFFFTLYYASLTSAYMERINFILKEDTK